MTALEHQVIRLRKWLRSVFGPRTSNVTIHNYFTISANHDPSRIARDVVDKIAERSRYPKPPTD